MNTLLTLDLCDFFCLDVRNSPLNVASSLRNGHTGPGLTSPFRSAHGSALRTELFVSMMSYNCFFLTFIYCAAIN